MVEIITLVGVVAALLGITVVSARSASKAVSAAAGKAFDAQLVVEADTALQFKSRVGLKSPFFVPRTNDVAPTATVSGPTGLDIQVPVVECAAHSDFGARWQLCVPKFSAAGNYRIAVSSGEVYDISVKEN